jgi:hypothetical protein
MLLLGMPLFYVRILRLFWTIIAKLQGKHLCEVWHDMRWQLHTPTHNEKYSKDIYKQITKQNLLVRVWENVYSIDSFPASISKLYRTISRS